MIEQLYVWLVQDHSGIAEAVVIAASAPQAQNIAEQHLADPLGITTVLGECEIGTHLRPGIIVPCWNEHG
jgi:hypothetical protein